MNAMLQLLRLAVCAALILVVPPSLAANDGTPNASAGAPKVLRVSFPVAETGFDPAQISDLYSRTITAHIFEGLYAYDHLARPAKIKPLLAAAMPEVSSDFRTWTVKLRPGIYFADDPAFKGRKREVVAEDYVYALKRFADPALKSPAWGGLEQAKISGLAALRQQALDAKKPFDYARDVPGVRALDRYTLQIRTDEPRPRMLETLAGGDLFGAMAREVVDFYGDRIAEHPVGSGPFRLAQWRRSSLIVLERNPDYREVRYDAEPAADDTEGQALLAKFKGRRLPMIDRIEVSIIEEQQPRWLAFLNGQIDLVPVPGEFVNTAMPGGKVAPNLVKQGIRGYRVVQPDTAITYFNMEHPVVGGYTPDKVALRRAIGLAIDVDREIRVVRRGQAIVAHSPIPPHTVGYDPSFRSENGDHDPARAKALLDLYGYVDRDGDGWRELPDGAPLVLEIATQPDQISRQFDELWKKNMDSIGVRLRFQSGKWPEQLKLARNAKLMMWTLGSTAAAPDGQGALARYHGPQAGGQNLARFKLAAFDAIYDRMLAFPTGPSAKRCSAKPSCWRSPTCRTRRTCTAWPSTWCTPGRSAFAARCSGRTSGNTSTSTRCCASACRSERSVGRSRAAVAVFTNRGPANGCSTRVWMTQGPAGRMLHRRGRPAPRVRRSSNRFGEKHEYTRITVDFGRPDARVGRLRRAGRGMRRRIGRGRGRARARRFGRDGVEPCRWRQRRCARRGQAVRSVDAGGGQARRASGGARRTVGGPLGCACRIGACPGQVGRLRQRVPGRLHRPPSIGGDRSVAVFRPALRSLVSELQRRWLCRRAADGARACTPGVPVV